MEDERRAKRTKQRHEQREHWAEIRGVLDGLIGQIEQQEARAERACRQGLQPWSCPARCAAGAGDCGRLQFRQQCAPTRAAIEQQQRRKWEKDHMQRVREVDINGQCGWQTVLDYSSMPVFECSDMELAETQHAFLTMWDGKARKPASLPQRPRHSPEAACGRSRLDAGCSIGWQTASICARRPHPSTAGLR